MPVVTQTANALGCTVAEVRGGPAVDTQTARDVTALMPVTDRAIDAVLHDANRVAVASNALMHSSLSSLHAFLTFYLESKLPKP
jgi:hypothetical protein